MAKDKKRGFLSWLGFGAEAETDKQRPANTTKCLADEPETGAGLTLAKLPIDSTQPAIEASIENQLTENNQPPAASVEIPEYSEQFETEAAIDQVEKKLAERAIPHEAEFDSNISIDEDLFIDETAKVVENQRQSADIFNEFEPNSVELDVNNYFDQDEFEAKQPFNDLDDSDLLPMEAESTPGQEPEQPSKEGFFTYLKRSLLKTKQNLGSGFLNLFVDKKIDDDLFEELEEQLLIADVGVNTSRKIIDSLTEHANHQDLKNAEALYAKLKEEMTEILAPVSQPLDISSHKPFVILMVGVNGVGKTTTIGKLARQFQAQGKSVMLAAGDTFRAAAVEQLQVWGQRNNIPVIAQHTNADSASVIYDAMQAAQARGIDVLLADTAGRLQNKTHLMEELKKIVRVIKKLDENAPHEVMLTLDASTGQNAVSQAQLFNDTVALTGITLTKLDGTAKGGVIFAIADRFATPIRYIGIGEGIDDLRPFNADDFIAALFARED